MLLLTCSLCFPVRKSEHFSFLGVNNQSNLSDMRCRTTFYTALGRLLMVDLGKYTHVLSVLISNESSGRPVNTGQ